MIPLNARILNITHIDLDGCSCSIVLKNVYKNLTYVFSSFSNIDEKLELVDYKKFDYVILTGIHPSEERYLDFSDNIILIDHHPSKYHDPSKNRFVMDNEKISSVSLVYKWVSSMYKIDLSHLSNFVKTVNNHERKKTSLSRKLNNLLFYRYRPDVFVKKFGKGRVDFNNEEIDFLDDLVLQIDGVYDDVDVTLFDTINACMVFDNRYTEDIAEKLIDNDNLDIVIIKNPNFSSCSIRVSEKNSINIGEVLEAFGWGGGLEKSAGFPVKTDIEFQNKMETLERHLFTKYKEIRIEK